MGSKRLVKLHIAEMLSSAVPVRAGYLFMLRSNLASNPFGLTALVCTVTFLGGGLSHGPFRHAAYLLLV